MRKNIFVGLVLCLMFIVTNSFAAESLLLSITADKKLVPEGKVTKLYVSTDEYGDANELVYEVVLRNGKVEKRDSYNLENYIGEDIVLVNEKGRDVVKLNVDTFATHNGGIFFVDYLVSGVSGKRKKFEIDLVRENDEWLIVSNRNKAVTKMHFVANTFFGKVVGIKKINLK